MDLFYCIPASSVYQNRSKSFRPTTFEVNPGINVYQMPSSSIYPHLPWIIAAGAAGIFWMGILVLMFCYVRRRQTTSTSARDDLRQSIVHHSDIPDLKMEVLYENATYTNTLNNHQIQCPEIAEFENNYQYIS